MSDSIPLNDLDRTIIALRKSKAALPDFMRNLGERELWFLVPWHPEVEDTDMELKNGMELPFSMLQDKEGPVVPLFSSFERAQEAMEKFQIPERTYAVAAMQAMAVLQILGNAKLRAVVNKGCTTGEVTIGPDMMRDVADGSAFAIKGDGTTVEAKAQILDPADYPTDLVQSIFDFVRQHRCFRAAWVLGREKSGPEPDGGRGYNVMVLLEPRDDELLHDLNLVAQSAKRKTDEVELGAVPENDGTYTRQLFSHARPFYVAADYEPPAAME